LAIPENLTAPQLVVYLQQVLTGLLDRGVHVASYAADGSTVERAVQELLKQQATRTEEIHFEHPADDGTKHEDVVITLYFFGEHPIAILQDPKHLLKTFRNNVFSGAQVPILPNHPILFSDIRNMALSDDSPIFHRDVIKVDRQDDNAATRLFSGASLEWLSKRHPEQRGLFTFLFICGELIDAYQSRSLSIHERTQMVLRARYFFELWEKFIDVGGYSKQKHYVSPQCAKIVKILIDGFLQLVAIYRRYGGKYPLLPWLHCTEAVEHVFGMCRQIIKDFTMIDFHRMIPKLFIKLREAFFSTQHNDGKSTASGYSHTHTDTRGLNLAGLASFPTDDEINMASKHAYGEASSIFEYLGLSPQQLYQSQTMVRLPNISSWFKDESAHEMDNEPYIDSDADSGSTSDTDNLDALDYQAALDCVEHLDDSMTEADGRRLMNLRYATVALSVDDRMKMWVYQFSASLIASLLTLHQTIPS
jgi:hypothetical protein